MGYTHYWKTKRAFTEEEWKKFTDGTKKIVKSSKVSIKGGLGTGQPSYTNEEIRLNGDSSKGEDYETFVVTKKEIDFEFCKTARQPYDEVVCACLLLMKKILGDDCEVSSDGDMETEEEWLKGKALFKKAIK